jgi:periodic tryptophan protein 1
VFDSRQPDKVLQWKLSSDVECMKWDPYQADNFYVSMEDGIVQCYNARVGGSKPVFTLHAHDLAVTSIDVNPHIEGFFVTGSADKTAKLWHVKDGKPSCLATRDLQCGKVFSCLFNPDSPLVIGVAGSNGKVVVWNVGEIQGVRKAFPQRQFGERKYQEIVEQAEEVDEMSDDEEDEDEEMGQGEEEEDSMDGDSDHV